MQTLGPALVGRALSLRESQRAVLSRVFSFPVGINRITRWERASDLGLSPPLEVVELIQNHADDPRYTQWYVRSMGPGP